VEDSSTPSGASATANTTLVAHLSAMASINYDHSGRRPRCVWRSMREVVEELRDMACDYFSSLRQAFAEGPPPELTQIVEAFSAAFLQRARVYTFGNGACAASAAHMACDLGRSVALGAETDSIAASSRLRVTSLADNSTLLTATANDYCYEHVFVEQLQSQLNKDDVIIAISVGGASPNLPYALDYARRHSATTIRFTGSGSSAESLVSRCDIAVRSPVTQTEQIEDIAGCFSITLLRSCYSGTSVNVYHNQTRTTSTIAIRPMTSMS
jgi:D-sedoheptulose 7-phosphate isomerase